VILAALALTLAEWLARVNALAAQHRLPEAERAAAEAVREFPQSRDAQLALANVLLWEGRYSDARGRFAALVARNDRDADARLGMAQAEYWSGDYRRALADFRRVASRPEARRAIAEIEAASRPGYVAAASFLSDPQPYRAASGDVSLFMFSDPLTKWQLDLGALRRESGALRDDSPFVRAGVETTLGRTTLRAALGSSAVAGSLLRVDYKVGSSVISAAVSREALLRTAASLRAHPTADIVSLRWADGDRYAVHAEKLRYFDRNDGSAVDAFALHPFGAISFGASAAWRDTRESRFTGALYDPYYTPQRQRDLRAVASWSAKGFGVHLDGGIGHDAVAGSFHPWRAAASWTKGAFRVDAEHDSTAFYRSNEIRASVAGRF
jgi:tetratricopeptide (TPR) repeat protein